MHSTQHGPQKEHQYYEHHERQPYRRSSVHLLGALTPLIIGELVRDPNKRWRWIRIGSVVVAALGELEFNWRRRVSERRDRERER